MVLLLMWSHLGTDIFGMEAYIVLHWTLIVAAIGRIFFQKDSSLKKYCIDYRQGGMGNTVLAHILYSCEQVDLDLNNFFSATGNSHNITKFNHTDLTASHLIEFPNKQLDCIVQLYSDGWNILLQYKMSYEKWHGSYPSLTNYTKFFNLITMEDQSDRLWRDYYSKIKDPLWPDCLSYKDLNFLPKYIQEEIHQTYQHPVKFAITDNKDFLEFLSNCYYDSFNDQQPVVFPKAIRYPLSKYFSNDLDMLKNKIHDIFHWNWNDCKSETFHQTVMYQNARYFKWLDKIKTIYDKTINFIEHTVQLDLWENAIVIAMVCKHFNLNPSQLCWDTEGCFLVKNNVLLINYLKKEINHGQTI